MKRITLTLAGLALVAGVSVGCSKSNETSSTSTTASTAKASSDQSLPGGADKVLADAEKCAEMASAYTGLFTPLMGGGDEASKKQVEQTLEDMKGKVPANIKADLEKLQDGLKKNTSLLDLGQYLASDEFTKANDNVTNYLTVECSKVGG